MKPRSTIYWHDYEAFGANARRDRASQFAGIRTDLELNEIDEPLVIYCQPAPDYLPHPQACLITGITPQLAMQQGLPETDFIRRIHEQISRPGTCTAGYNNIRFDDELSRQLLYRNFYDPYEREWKNGNSRWDIIDMLRLCYAVRPEGIQWPDGDRGGPSFRLELLSAANDISHEDAHDALSDVRATIALAKLVKQVQPKLYDYAFDMRLKKQVQSVIDLERRKPLVHVSAMYPASRGSSAIVMPLVRHPLDNNGVLFYDLQTDPSPWLSQSEEEMRASLFTPREQRAADEIRLPVSVVHINRSPMLAPLPVMTTERMKFLGFDLATARRHWHLIHEHPDFVRRLTLAMQGGAEADADDDPDFMIYSGGFFSEADKRLMTRIRSMDAVQLADQSSAVSNAFLDARLPELLFRYRARNFPQTLSVAEKQRWQDLCRRRLLPEAPDAGSPAGLTATQCLEQVKALSEEPGLTESDRHVLDELQEWVQAICEHLAK
ncbi:exodeoxyribonuclease I [Pseudohongiella spirulinae]|uniref:Exodeoxyribonuclease I n=1 Tax=Pseudohongiella spirulinae TaxID=1249552 RepID=A0A0S2KD41_9GAMM|nr:exodeoxyribonuclease I [Pseudohongiella spirulinae]ALO46019.1 Exodeoxyribonuclease I [Pseudohongiella spirulinae]